MERGSDLPKPRRKGRKMRGVWGSRHVPYHWRVNVTCTGENNSQEPGVQMLLRLIISTKYAKYITLDRIDNKSVELLESNNFNFELIICKEMR